MSLTPKQETFVQGLFKGLSQRKAYIEAGYKHLGKTEGYIDKLACELAKDSKISGRLQELKDEVTNKNIADEIEIAEFYTSQIRNKELESRDRRAAADSLAKTKGMFKDKVEHSGEIKMPSIIIGKGE